MSVTYAKAPALLLKKKPLYLFSVVVAWESQSVQTLIQPEPLIVKGPSVQPLM